MPRLVTAAVPSRMPEGSKGLRGSKGTLLQLTTIPARSRAPESTCSLRKLLKRELGPTQIRSLLARRDLILEKFDSDRQIYGDSFAFREERP